MSDLFWREPITFCWRKREGMMSDATNYASNHDATGELWRRCKEQQAEIERLKRLAATYVADHGKAQDQQQAEIERLRGALLTCQSLAVGRSRLTLLDRCVKICEVTNEALAAHAAGGEDALDL